MKKILIIRFSSIGDIVLTSPVIRCIKEQLHNCEIHYLTKAKFISILAANPDISKIYSIEDGISDVIGDLKKENYDFILDLHKNYRSSGVCLHLRKPRAVFPKLNIRKWLLVNLKLDLMPSIHIVDRYFKATRKLKVTNDEKGLDYYIAEADVVNVNAISDILRNGFYTWAIGGAHKTKLFPEEKIVSVISKVDRPFILLGGKDDYERGEKISSASGSNAINGCGKFSINQSASIIKQSELLITNDTGMMHIGAAFKMKIISLWGNTVPAFGMYPYMPGHEDRSKIFEIKNLRCRPCSKIGYSKCPKKHFRCMEDIEVIKLVDVIKSI